MFLSCKRLNLHANAVATFISKDNLKNLMICARFIVNLP